MTHWNRPRQGTELRELDRERAPAGALNRRWYSVAFLAGVFLVFVVGFSTDLFDSGPTDRDVSDAFREGFDEATNAAETYWENELDDRWWEGYKRGQASETSMAPIIVQAVREGFSWEGGFEAGMRSGDIDVDESYRQGWMEGYRMGWTRVTGESTGARFVPHPPGPGFASRVIWTDGGGEP